MSDTGQTSRSGLAAYITVTAAYWAFMLTDGALRMLVLLHFHTLGFSAIQLAYLFLLYELMGVVTNLSAGWLAARFGLTSTLYAGLGLQIVALVLLAQLDPSWSLAASVGFVMGVQGLSGIAKDLSKMSAKSAVKVLAPKGDGSLFRWVAVLTGSKNAVKGLGFLLGAALLALAGFHVAIWLMAALLALILLGTMLFMPSGLPQGKKSAKFNQVFSKDAQINRLSLARMFLFGARDVWFVVGIPIYFYSVLSDGSVAGNRAAFFTIGSFMAVWIILYGFVQGIAPRILNAQARDTAALSRSAATWCAILTLIPAVLALAVALNVPGLTAVLVGGLLLFGFVFAVNSALHSYLILAFTSAERVTLDVGFYYMSNAAGRLIGTLLSGLSYQLGGLPLCLLTAAAMAGASAIAARQLRMAA
ncbi:organoarsenical effux MFS transporter ArsJ [Cognatishimia sp. SS12]|uniref:organoarsenical effux MFS transporter ArsJ n=1 Tax=Cognatishimia sp. SS12 TaxID=2979465 RepID=UPI002330DA55|nr:organoarsenical effux MFS transporter ArsJ [Cognatishimia sp. SS12]MDC0736706.1 organoarsenical effux MFS transporter ArsJ [Cognatishimia sp. SS12]